MKLLTSTLALRTLSALLFIPVYASTDLRAEEAATVVAKPSRSPEKGCAWKPLTVATPPMSMLVQECNFGDRKITMVALGNAVAEKYSDVPEGTAPEKIIEMFANDAGDAPAVVLKKKFVEKLNPYEQQHCVPYQTKSKFDVEKPFTDPKKSAWLIRPDKEYSAKIKKETPKGDMPPDSCGPYGAPVDSRAYFEFHAGNTKEFAWVVVGQDTPLFDEQSLSY